MRHRLVRATAGTFVLRIAAIGLGFASNVALARLLGVGAFGIFALVAAWTTLLTMPAMFGFDRLLVRELAAFQATADWQRVRGILHVADRTVLTLAVLLGAAMTVVGVALGDPHGLGAPVAFAVGGAMVPLLALVNLRQSALQGLHQVTRSFIGETLVRPGTLIVLSGVSLIGGLRHADAPVGSIFLLIGTVLAFLTGRALLRAHLGPEWRGPMVPPHGWSRAAIPLAYLGTIAVIGGQADLVLVGLLARPEDAGAYAVAVRGSVLISLPLIVINATTAPSFARLWRLGDVAQLQRTVTLSVRGALLLTIPIAAAFMLFPAVFLGLFGEGFERAVAALGVLSIGRVVNVAVGPTGTLLAMTGQERVAALGATVGPLLEVALAVALIPSVGLVGAAVASSAALIASSAIQVATVRRRLGVRPSIIGL